MVIIKKTSTIYAGEDVEKEPLFTIRIINEHIYYESKYGSFSKSWK